jgi:polar amino acid transport system substrate-binding protein
MSTFVRGIASLSVAVVVFAACNTAGASPSPVPPTATASAAITPSATPDACAKANLKVLTAGTLTIGTGNPAYPPYYIPEDPQPAGSVWGFGDPTNGKGLESATAYALAEKLGFAKTEVTWVPVDFNVAIQAGPKPFDLDLSEVSYSAERAQAVDLSDGYFDLAQAVVALKSNPIAQVTTVAGLKPFRLGTQVGTSSYNYIVNTIQPTPDARAFDTLDGAVSAVIGKSIDGIVVDLPTGFFMRDYPQIENSVIVGSLPTVGEVEHYSVLLAKGSPLTSCVNAAVAAIKADGTLAAIVEEWVTSQGAPALK